MSFVARWISEFEQNIYSVRQALLIFTKSIYINIKVGWEASPSTIFWSRNSTIVSHMTQSCEGHIARDAYVAEASNTHIFVNITSITKNLCAGEKNNADFYFENILKIS